MQSLHVVAGVIRNAEGKILIAQRNENQKMANYWEFPGGKVEHLETIKFALKRELTEELNLNCEIGDLLYSEILSMPKRKLKIHFLEISSYENEIEMRVHKSLSWVNVSDLKEYNFLPADRKFINQLIEKYS